MMALCLEYDIGHAPDYIRALHHAFKLCLISVFIYFESGGTMIF
jgi:hypothetical protein